MILSRKKIAFTIIFLLAGVAFQRLSLAYSQAPGNYRIWFPIVIRENPNPIHEGIATYYYATGEGTCSFDPSPEDLMVAAMNGEEWDNAAYCGAYVRVVGPDGDVVVRIVDRCPECEAGHIDLSQQAFSQIAELSRGIVPVTWQVQSPPISGPIAYHFKEGSNQWWSAVQIRNHRNPISKLEYSPSPGEWVSVSRTYYNYFVQTDPGMGPGPYSFRVTDCYGNVLTDHDIPFIEGGSVSGSDQFPSGP